MTPTELEFFNSLSGTLEIELTEPAEPIGTLLNKQAPATAQVKSVKLQAEVFDPETEESRELTTEELDSTALLQKHIKLRGESGDIVLHTAPNGQYFTVRNLLQAVEETERITRGNTEWMGGVDVHHCFFEGLCQEEGNVWEICWGS